MFHRSLCCLGLRCLVLSSSWAIEKSRFFFWLMEWIMGSCSSDHVCHCAHLSLHWRTDPSEFPVQILAQPSAVSVGRTTGMSNNKNLHVDRKDMSKIYTHIVMSLVILGSLYFLYMICHIVCTYLWSSLSLCRGPLQNFYWPKWWWKQRLWKVSQEEYTASPAWWDAKEEKWKYVVILETKQKFNVFADSFPFSHLCSEFWHKAI